jgi:IclR family acetate operon transcriptional repressor
VGAPHMKRLVDELGKSANLAMFDGDQIVYLAQAQSR